MMSRGSTAPIQVLFGVSLSLTVLAGAPPCGAQGQATGSVVFQEDFESGLGRWRIYGDGAAQIVDSGDPARGRVLALVPQGDAYALIEGSERWGGMRLEGELLFPSPRDSYLGVIYNFDDLALWVNGRFHWFIPRRSAAWHDFFRNPAHAGQSIPVPLLAGDNDLVFRVRGGVYASGGFYARVIDRDATQP